MSEATAEEIRRRLVCALQPLELEVEDESAHHAGHRGARDGGGHYRVRLVSAAFQGMDRLQRHRLVYDALAEMMKSSIHALAIEAHAPGE